MRSISYGPPDLDTLLDVVCGSVPTGRPKCALDRLTIFAACSVSVNRARHPARTDRWWRHPTGVIDRQVRRWPTSCTRIRHYRTGIVVGPRGQRTPQRNEPAHRIWTGTHHQDARDRVPQNNSVPASCGQKSDMGTTRSWCLTGVRSRRSLGPVRVPPPDPAVPQPGSGSLVNSASTVPGRRFGTGAGCYGPNHVPPRASRQRPRRRP